MKKTLVFVLLCSISVLSQAADIGFGTYGNWCGLNHPLDPSTAEAPVDQLDASCQRHDQCYVDKGQYACECDAILQKELSDALKANQYQDEAKHFARSAHHYFKGSPCKGTPSSKTGPTKAIQNLLNKGKRVVDKVVAVEKPVTRLPPHRSRRALLTHRALTLGIWRQSAVSGEGAEFLFAVHSVRAIG